MRWKRRPCENEPGVKGGALSGLLLLSLSLPASGYPLDRVVEMTATGYAPLDPRAVRGMCFSGDPRVTASGKRTEPGITVAAPPDVPFGIWLHIEGLGWRRVDDRGGKIKGNRIDICFRTRKEAFQWGRRKVRVFFPVWLERRGKNHGRKN